MALRSLLLVLMVLGVVIRSSVADEVATAMAGQAVASVLQSFRDGGMPLAWSSNLVPADLPVLFEPAAGEPEDILQQVLKPHGLVLARTEGIYLVVRDQQEPAGESLGSLLVVVRGPDAGLVSTDLLIEAKPELETPDDLGSGVFQYRQAEPGLYEFQVSGVGYVPALRPARIKAGEAATLHLKLDAAPAELDTLTVSTSRYVLLSNSQFFIDQRAIQNLPDIGDDPIRSVHRLPGAAAGGWSARSHFRGGEENETAIFLNGLQLLDPFHVRDFHNVFSSIDARTIAGVEAYTGGFPVQYGDRMSGILLLRSQRPEEPRRHEIGISVFNTSLLTSGYSKSGEVDWLFSARRSNLDLVLDKQEHGEPSYNDIFAEVGWNISPRTRLVFNAQRADDGVRVITENKPEEQEFADSDTLNENFWVQAETQWTAALYSQTVLSVSKFSNLRNAVANDPTQLVGRVFDKRRIDMIGLRQDWGLDISNKHSLKWGFELRRQDADYRYISEARYRGAYLLFPGVPEKRERDITAMPDGNSFMAYVSDRWQLGPFTTLDAGLRWDKQTWLGPASGSQLSPRLSLLHKLNEDTDLRLTWGKYHQSQGIHELQVEDGLEHFFPAQESSHLIAGIHFRWQHGLSLRMEAFYKDYRNLKPRFENLLDPLPLIPEFEVDRIRVAPESGRSAGMELTLEQYRGAGFNWWASYSWSEVSDDIGGRDEFRNWDQRHSVQAGLGWQSSNWEVGAAVKVHSGWPTTAADLLGDSPDNYRIEYGPRNAENLNSFFNLDARLARVWEFPGSRLTAFFEVSNLTDRKNQCCVDYDVDLEEDPEDTQLERSVDHWLGITPAIGVLWEF